MSKQRNIILSAAAGILIPAALSISAPAQSSEAGAFIGGMVTSRVLGNMRERTDAEQQQAYYAQQSAQQQQQPVQQAAPAAPAQLTPEQRIQQLDKLEPRLLDLDRLGLDP